MKNIWIGLLFSLSILIGIISCSSGNGDESCADEETLRDVADCAEVSFGAAVNPGAAADPAEEEYRRLLAEEFNYLATEDGPRRTTVQPDGPDTWNWEMMDATVEIAERNRQPLKGHNLTWFLNVPAWADALEPVEFESAWRTYLEAAVERYRGRVYAWDVINEPLGGQGQLTGNPHLDHLGPDYIPKGLT